MRKVANEKGREAERLKGSHVAVWRNDRPGVNACEACEKSQIRELCLVISRAGGSPWGALQHPWSVHHAGLDTHPIHTSAIKCVMAEFYSIVEAYTSRYLWAICITESCSQLWAACITESYAAMVVSYMQHWIICSQLWAAGISELYIHLWATCITEDRCPNCELQYRHNWTTCITELCSHLWAISITESCSRLL